MSHLLLTRESTLSELEFGIDRGLLRDVMTGECEADVLVDILRAAGYNHQTTAFTVVIADPDGE